MADSRPLPGPCTRTCSLRTPRFITSRPTFSAATVAAKGVLFLEPLNPALPAVPHAIVLPRMSVMVISTLLNVAEMWAMPSDSTTFLERFAAFAGAAAGAGAAGAVESAGGVGCAGVVIGYFLVAFFLPAMARRGPFLVRALVWVRWPRTGRPFRWREPR